MLSKQPNLPVGVKSDALEFEFNLEKIFKGMGRLLCSKFPEMKTASAKSQISNNAENYEVNKHRAKSFEKNFLKMGENLDMLTHYTVRGISVESNFFIKMEISLQRVIGGTYQESRHFPILIRSRKLDSEHNFDYPQDPGIY